MDYVAVALGGMMGALARYGVGHLILILGLRSHYATLSVNVIGSFFIGVCFVLSQKFQIEILKPFLMVGFLGAFTTFSAFTLELVQHYQTNHQSSWVLFYVMASVLFSLAACYAGVRIATYYIL